MAESLLFGIADRIIGSLTSAAVQEIVSIWGAKDELSQLEDTISTIKDVLLDAEEQQVHNHQVRNWLKRLEDAVHEADDLMDDVSTEALRREVMGVGSNMAKQVCIFFSPSNQIVFHHNMAHKIKDIKEKLAAISKNRVDFQLEVRREETRVVTRAREQTHSYVPHEEVIGRDNDKKAILELLFDPITKENVSVLPIVGPGGLGKTTLAQLVFNDEQVQKKFDPKLWVCVSNDFDVRSVVEKLIKSATNKSLENLEMDQLQRELRKEINGKQYLLVLDDVWNENRELWLKLKNLLSNGAKGSRIMITTRSHMVAKVTHTMEPYVLGTLDEDKSWSLFKKVVFEYGEEPKDSNSVKLGMKILERCGGIPLAIRTIGRMLYMKNPETEWTSFLKMEFSSVPQNENDILPTLKLSYDNLPCHLKQCFAYCSLFPKDHEIYVNNLINLWIAQGFIKPSIPTQSLKDTGYEYFMDLLWRSFFLEVRTFDKHMGYFKMHDLMHDLAVQVAGTECATLRLNEGKIDTRTRHISFICHLDSSRKIPTSLFQAEKIRTLLLPNQSVRLNESTCDVSFVGSFKFLRALDLHFVGLKAVPESIGKLIHLRYLDLSGNRHIRTLPNSITKLQNLQILRLTGCDSFQELPRDITKLVNLRYLENYGCPSLTHMPRGLGNLTNLQTLEQYVLDKGAGSASGHSGEAGELKELMALNNLRGVLSIRNLGRGNDAIVQCKAANLKEKQHVEFLMLVWDFKTVHVRETKAVDYEMTVECLQPHPNLKQLLLQYYGGVRLPSWLPSLTKLGKFVLKGCWKCQNLVQLNQLPCLKMLCLEDLPALEYISNNVTDDVFSTSTTLLSSIETLELKRLPDLKGWWKDAVDDEYMLPSFPCLCDLYIEDCPKLTSMPLYPYLKESLTLVNTGWKPFQQTMMNTAAGPAQIQTSSCLTPLSNLRFLKVFEIEDLQSVSEWLRSLTSLRKLRIGECPKLKYLSPDSEHLASLEELVIHKCEELDIYNGDGIMWQALKSLRYLSLETLPQMETLPDELQHITNLQFLFISGCNNLIAIPEWISNLKSLKELDIFMCPNLTSVPEGMRDLTSLQTLRISDCPVLSQRCQREKGEDWPKVAHIPELLLQSTSTGKSSPSSSASSDSNWKILKSFRLLQLCNK